MLWNTDDDIFFIRVEKMIAELKSVEKLTKRTTCSIAAKIFDPLGFIEPFTVTVKILMQELWVSKIG